MSYVPYHQHFHKSRVPYSNDMFHHNSSPYATQRIIENKIIEYNIEIDSYQHNSVEFTITKFRDNSINFIHST